MNKMLAFLTALLLSVGLFGKEPNYFYDTNQVRYQLYQTNAGKPYNWLLLPGGPGADSSYLRALADELKLPGNVWLIDLPGNGDNLNEEAKADFNVWFKIFPEVIEKFDNPVLIGHSFGGMFPLCFPELEKMLKGFVILNSTPCQWMEEAVAYGKQFHLPDLSKEMEEFVLHPNDDTFKVALNACMPYYFPPHSLEKGKAYLAKVPCQYFPCIWWGKWVVENQFTARWIPERVPTLIITSKYDCICPHTLFDQDQRFKRPNIRKLFFDDAGHCVWIDAPQALKWAIDGFASRLP